MRSNSAMTQFADQHVLPTARPRIAVDGIFFQSLSSGIARVWSALLEEWAKSGFIDHILLLNRGGADVPRIAGLRSIPMARYDYSRTGRESLEVERACRELGVNLFVSTYYTAPTSTPSLFFGYDMIPESTGVDLTEEVWREKRRAILHASAHLMISENSARDLEKLYGLPPKSTFVARCGIWRSFHRATGTEIASFRTRYGIGEAPYVLTVGERSGVGGYKNVALVFKAIGGMPDQKRFTVVCVGGEPYIENQLKAAAPGARIVRLALDDEDLRAAYGGAHALLYPSRYEGFGMPVLEAMACGAPVVTCRNSSLTEVAGDAAIFVGEDDADGMAAALERLCDASLRNDYIARGAERANQFSFSEMAGRVGDALLETHRRLLQGELPRPNGIWQDFREELQVVQDPLTWRLRLLRGIRCRIGAAVRPRIGAVIRRAGLYPQVSRLRSLWR
jgi:glycosyltransferase involved in cell wall biosynthesis